MIAEKSSFKKKDGSHSGGEDCPYSKEVHLKRKEKKRKEKKRKEKKRKELSLPFMT